MKRYSLLLLFAIACAPYLDAQTSPATAQKPVPGPPQQATPDKKIIVANARKAYYNLRAQGLVSFEAKMQPDFAVMLAEQEKKDPSAAAFAQRTLRALHFAVMLQPDGDIDVKGTTDLTPEQACESESDRSDCVKRVSQSFEQIFSGLQQAVKGFFQGWSVFMLTDPFPDGDDFQLAQQPASYLLTFKDHGADVALTMGRDFQITELKVSAPDFVSTMTPQFTRTPQGYVLAAYRGQYESAAEAKDASNVKVDVKIDYQNVQALQLPARLTIDSLFNGLSSQMQLNFTDIHAKKK